MYTVYILYNQTIDKYYTGITSNLANRFREHNKPLHFSKFTRKQPGEWKLVYEETFASKFTALKREKEIKRTKSRKYILKLVEQSRL